jgi:hypothetical protein
MAKRFNGFKGFVLQRGISPIDGSPFVVIMTIKTSNRKTGPMFQVWIIPRSISI